MQTKLTLSIEKQVIINAKVFAKKSGRSLSDLIESYLRQLLKEKVEEKDEELDKIYGIVTLPDKFDYKNENRTIRIVKQGL